MSSLKAGLNKVVLLEVSEESKSKITLPDHLKDKKYTVVAVGSPRTTFDNTPTYSEGQTVHIVPNTGFKTKVSGQEYVVCNYEDVLIVG